MADILLHPNHYLFKQIPHPLCATCRKEIFPGTPVDIRPHEDGQRVWYRHKECAPQETPEAG